MTPGAARATLTLERVELQEILLHLRTPFTISSGTFDERRILLVRFFSDGHEGWGECVPPADPIYTGETVDTAWHVLTEFMRPRLPGLQVRNPADVLEPLTWIRGHQMASAALEMAAWDLAAKSEGISLAVKLGGTHPRVPVGVSVGIQESDNALLNLVSAHLDRGYRRVKIKIRPGRDMRPLRTLRERFPDASLMADATGAYAHPGDPVFRELDTLGLSMIEQPLPPEDLVGHARLQAHLSTPLCLDESIPSARAAERTMSMEACRIIDVKPGRMGGHAPSRQIHDFMRRTGAPVWRGGMLETGIGRAQYIALASLPGLTLPGDLSESRHYWIHDIVHPEFEMDEGMVEVPGGPGSESRST